MPSLRSRNTATTRMSWCGDSAAASGNGIAAAPHPGSSSGTLDRLMRDVNEVIDHTRSEIARRDEELVEARTEIRRLRELVLDLQGKLDATQLEQRRAAASPSPALQDPNQLQHCTPFPLERLHEPREEEVPPVKHTSITTGRPSDQPSAHYPTPKNNLCSNCRGQVDEVTCENQLLSVSNGQILPASDISPAEKQSGCSLQIAGEKVLQSRQHAEAAGEDSVEETIARRGIAIDDCGIESENESDVTEDCSDPLEANLATLASSLHRNSDEGQGDAESAEEVEYGEEYDDAGTEGIDRDVNAWPDLIRLRWPLFSARTAPIVKKFAHRFRQRHDLTATVTSSTNHKVFGVPRGLKEEFLTTVAQQFGERLDLWFGRRRVVMRQPPGPSDGDDDDFVAWTDIVGERWPNYHGSFADRNLKLAARRFCRSHGVFKLVRPRDAPHQAAYGIPRRLQGAFIREMAQTIVNDFDRDQERDDQCDKARVPAEGTDTEAPEKRLGAIGTPPSSSAAAGVVAWPDVVRGRWPHFRATDTSTKKVVRAFCALYGLREKRCTTTGAGHPRLAVGVPTHLHEELLRAVEAEVAVGTPDDNGQSGGDADRGGSNGESAMSSGPARDGEAIDRTDGGCSAIPWMDVVYARWPRFRIVDHLARCEDFFREFCARHRLERPCKTQSPGGTSGRVDEVPSHLHDTLIEEMRMALEPLLKDAETGEEERPTKRVKVESHCQKGTQHGQALKERAMVKKEVKEEDEDHPAFMTFLI